MRQRGTAAEAVLLRAFGRLQPPRGGGVSGRAGTGLRLSRLARHGVSVPNMSTSHASVTHLHILNFLRTYLPKNRGRTLRVLDLGCGNAVLTTYLRTELSAWGFDVEVYGIDVGNMQVQPREFFADAIANAMIRDPDYPWADRLALTDGQGAWPYRDAFFDAIVSNQVFEHVQDPDLVLHEIARTLKVDGHSVHLFPFRKYVLEGHIKVPCAHWINDDSAREAWIRGFYRIQKSVNRGKYAAEGAATGWSLDSYASAHSDYLVTETRYQSFEEFCRKAAQAGMRVSLAHTVDFYALKAADMLGRRLPTCYQKRPNWGKAISGHLLQVAGSVSVTILHASRYSEWREEIDRASESIN